MKRMKSWDNPLTKAAEEVEASPDNEAEEAAEPDVDIAARVQDGTYTNEQGIELMQKEVEALRDEVRAEDPEGMRSPNMHQALVHWAAAEEGDGHHVDAASHRGPALFASAFMVLGQCIVVVAVWLGAALPACSTSDQCGEGMYCNVGQMNRCVFCGTDVPLPEQVDPTTGNTLNWPYAQDGISLNPDFGGYNTTLVAEVCAAPTDRPGLGGLTRSLHTSWIMPKSAVVSWCETCVRPLDSNLRPQIDGTVDPLTGAGLIAANVAAMGYFDRFTMVFAAAVVALEVVGELRDVTICTFAIRHAGDRLTPAWRFIMTLLGGMRRWLFLPTLVSTVPILVLYKGGDALSICFNTVAVLFLCEIDNIMLTNGLGEDSRKRVEESGRVELGEKEATDLLRTKAVHVFLIMVFVPAAVRSRDALLVLVLPPLAFWLGGVAENVGAGGDAATIARGIGLTTASCLLGLVGFIMLALPCLYSVRETEDWF
jgi:hypothetical protein